MKTYKIEQYNAQVEDIHFQTKFGGQPDWISTPQWPVSEAWGKRPMKFIGQVRLDEFLWYPCIFSKQSGRGRECIIVAASYKLASLLHKCRWRTYHVYIPERKQKGRLYFN